MKATFVFYLAGMMLISACQTQNNIEVTILLDEFSYSPSNIELKVGQVVTINVINNGALQHEIMFGRSVMMMAGSASGFSEDMFEVAGVEPQGMFLMDDPEAMPHAHNDDGSVTFSEDNMMEDMNTEIMGHSGYMTVVNADFPTATIVFEVTAKMLGEWQFGCFLENGTHYSTGMYGTLTVVN